MPKPHKFRELIKILRDFDDRFGVFDNAGKGSHRQIVHPDIKGQKRSCPVKCHGNNTEIGVGMIKQIIRRFELPDDLL